MYANSAKINWQTSAALVFGEVYIVIIKKKAQSMLSSPPIFRVHEYPVEPISAGPKITITTPPTQPTLGGFLLPVES